MKRILIILLILGLFMAGNKSYGQTTINMQMVDTFANVNNFINYPIRVTNSLTGQGVLSYKLQFSFNANLLSPQGVVTTGTIANSLGTPTVNVNVPGQITVAGAGATPLTGSGVFIYLRFKVVGSGGTYLSNTGTANNFFNEGNPAMAFSGSGNFNCIGLPTIYISPSTAVILKGQTQQFDASNGTAPYTWSSTNTVVATINNSGLLTANQIGTTTVRATDATSNTGNSGTIEVRGYSLYIPDTTGPYNSYINIPVRSSNLTGLNILSGSFTLSYNTAAISEIQIVTTGTLLSSVPTPTMNNNTTTGRIQISFAGTNAISGSGVLFYLRCKLYNVNGGGSGISFESALLNESLLGITRNGYLYYGAPPSISLTVPSLQLVYGDSLQLSVNNGTPPYVWSLSDSTIATISSLGMLKVKRSGIVRVSARDANSAVTTSGNIQLYDTYLKIGDTSASILTYVNVPVHIRSLPAGQSVYSVQGRVYTTNSSSFTLTDIITTGSGFDGAIVSKSIGSNYIQFAIAGTNPVPGNRVLFYVRGFETVNNQTGWQTGLYFQNLLLNEGTPLPLIQNGTITTACTILPNFIPQDTFKVCGSSYVLSAGNGYSSYNWNTGANTSSITVTQNGWYKCTVSNSSGCNGVDSAYVVFSQPKFTTMNAVACGSYTLPWGVTVSTSGSYANIYTASNGCDSTVTYQVNIKNNSTSTLNINICGLANSYTWNGNTYTNSGTYTYTTTNSIGCDSFAILILKIGTPTSSITNTAVCNTAIPYTWNGVLYNVAGTYSVTLTNVYGCDSLAVLNLTISNSIPSSPTAVTQTLVDNTCGARVYRYTVSAVNNAFGYAWTLPASIGGITGVVLDSGNLLSSRTIRVRYNSNAAAFSTDSIKVRAYSGCGSSLTKGFKLTNAALNVPTAPTSITITPLVTNVCGSRTYRYTAPALTAGTTTIAPATGYLWSFVGLLGENAVLDSGSLNGRIIVMRYTSNLAANIGDSVRVAYTSLCGNSLIRSLKLNNLVLNTPAAPTSILITSVSTNICSARIYRYAAPNLPVATASAGAANGYLWSFTGSLGSNAVLDSGSLTSQIIRVRFSSNTASSIGDSVRVRYNSVCGLGVNKALKLTNTLLNPPAAPSSVTITAVAQNSCSARIYRYTAPTLPIATATAGAATGYAWSFTGPLGANAVLDSGTLTSQIIRVRFSSNLAASTTDSVRVCFSSVCGFSPNKSVKMTNTVLNPPLSPTYITITAIVPSICGEKIYRYSAPSLPAATLSNGAATGYLWSFLGSLGSNAVLDSGTINSQIIRLKFTSNAAATSGDSVSVKYLSSCGNSTNKTVTFTNVITSVPMAPASIVITAVSPTACGARIYRYTAPNLVSATSTVAGANGYEWSFVGSLGTNAVIDSGTLNSQVVRIRYSSNVAALAGDSVKLRYNSSCGYSAYKASKLTNTNLLCPQINPVTKNAENKDFVTNTMIYPNPSKDEFNLIIGGDANTSTLINIYDQYGRCMYTNTKRNDRNSVRLGKSFNPGMYTLQLKQGNIIKTFSLIKL